MNPPLITLLLVGMAGLGGAMNAVGGALDYPSVWACDANKPNWYCDIEEAREPTVPVAKAATAPKPQLESIPDPKPIATRDIKTAAQLRVELKRREDVAIMNPTDENLKGYLEIWQATQEKGAVFADSWRRVVWQNPEFDYSLKRPANNAAIKIYDQGRDSGEEQQLKTLAREHGLIFFFRSDCPYCHAMAPSLKLLSEKYGIEVLPVSIDGQGMAEYPKPKDGRRQAAAWGVERVPALFIGSKSTGDHAPIGFGMMALSEVINRIFVLTGSKPGENF